MYEIITYIQYTYCIQVIWLGMYIYLALVCLGVIFLTSLRQKCHVKIRAKCHNFLVKVSQMTRVPQVEYHCCRVYNYVPELYSVQYKYQYTSIFLYLEY